MPSATPSCKISRFRNFGRLNEISGARDRDGWPWPWSSSSADLSTTAVSVVFDVRRGISAFRVAVGANGAHVYAIAHQLLAVVEHRFEVVQARVGAVIDVDFYRLADRQHVLAENILLPRIAADVRGVLVHDGVLRFVDDQHAAVLRARRDGQPDEGGHRHHDADREFLRHRVHLSLHSRTELRP